MKIVSNIEEEIWKEAENIDREIDEIHVSCDECHQKMKFDHSSVNVMAKKADILFEEHANNTGHSSVMVDIILEPEVKEEVDVDVTVGDIVQ